jgi:hypothetical protein
MCGSRPLRFTLLAVIAGLALVASTRVSAQQDKGKAPANPYVPPGTSQGDSGPGEKWRLAREGFRDLMNEDGTLKWPLGLSVLPPVLETQPLRDEIEAEVEAALSRVAEGRPVASSVRQANRDIERLRELLVERAVRVPLTEQAVTDAKGFLRRLQTRLRSL